MSTLIVPNKERSEVIIIYEKGPEEIIRIFDKFKSSYGFI